MRGLLQSPDKGWEVGVMCNLEGTVRIVNGVVVLIARKEFRERLPAGKQTAKT